MTGRYISIASDASKLNGDNNNIVAVREYGQKKFFECTNPSPEFKDLAAYS
jgi:hypothetical protein